MTNPESDFPEFTSCVSTRRKNSPLIIRMNPMYEDEYIPGAKPRYRKVVGYNVHIGCPPYLMSTVYLHGDELVGSPWVARNMMYGGLSAVDAAITLFLNPYTTIKYSHTRYSAWFIANLLVCNRRK